MRVDAPRPRWHASPNFTARRQGARPDHIVLHHTAMTSCHAALDRLCDDTAEVSAHYLIGADGTLWQMVHEDQRAWHAGAGAWGDVTDLNSRSIGIELDNPGTHPFSAPQMRVLAALLHDIMARRSIAAQRVIAHADMAPSRKCDPGPRFDWRWLALQGLSVWPTAGAEGGDFADNARRFGYVFDAQDEDAAKAVLAAFRLRFRPWASGPVDAVDRVLMSDLAQRFGVDRATASP